MVTHFTPSNVVEADVAFGSKVICAGGTVKLNGVPFAVKAIVELPKQIVTGWAPSPLTFKTLLNHGKLPAAMGVPLKLDGIVLAAPKAVDRSAITSNPVTPKFFAYSRRNILRDVFYGFIG